MDYNNEKGYVFTPCQYHLHLDCANGLWFYECPDCWTKVELTTTEEQ